MPVPTSIADLSTTAASNSPVGTDAVGTSLDDYLRSIQALLKQVVSAGTDVASATTITLPTDGNVFLVTGGTTIAGFADSWTGRAVLLRFAATVQLTHNGSSFILPGGANISAAAGDWALFVQTASGVWRCALYGRADGTALISNSFSGGTVPNPTTFSDTVTFNGNISANSRTVSPTELGYVDGVTGYIQTQLDGKQSTITGAATTIAGSNLTASRALVSDSGGKVGVAAVTATELGYVSGVTSAIQTQLGTKQATITGAATTIDTEDLTASRALVSNSSGKVAVSAVTSTELGLLSGKTSLGLTASSTVAPTGSAHVDFTSIPAGVTSIDIVLSSVRPGTGLKVGVQIGDSGGLETDAAYYGADAEAVAYFACSDASASSESFSGVIQLRAVDADTWIMSGVVYGNDSTGSAVPVAGSRSLSGTLDRLRVLASDGGYLAGYGQVRIIYQ